MKTDKIIGITLIFLSLAIAVVFGGIIGPMGAIGSLCSNGGVVQMTTTAGTYNAGTPVIVSGILSSGCGSPPPQVNWYVTGPFLVGMVGPSGYTLPAVDGSFSFTFTAPINNGVFTVTAAVFSQITNCQSGVITCTSTTFAVVSGAPLTYSETFTFVDASTGGIVPNVFVQVLSGFTTIFTGNTGTSGIITVSGLNAGTYSVAYGAQSSLYQGGTVMITVPPSGTLTVQVQRSSVNTLTCTNTVSIVSTQGDGTSSTTVTQTGCGNTTTTTRITTIPNLSGSLNWTALEVSVVMALAGIALYFRKESD